VPGLGAALSRKEASALSTYFSGILGKGNLSELTGGCLRLRSSGALEGLDMIGAELCKSLVGEGWGGAEEGGSPLGWKNGDFVLVVWGVNPLLLLSALGSFRLLLAAVKYRKCPPVTLGRYATEDWITHSPQAMPTTAKLEPPPGFSDIHDANSSLARYIPKELEGIFPPPLVKKSTPASTMTPSAPSFDIFWVTHFPMFELNKEAGGVSAAHHPFTAPSPGLEENLSDILKEGYAAQGSEKNKIQERALKITAAAYDLVANGCELGGGSLRIHCPKLQKGVLEVVLGAKEEGLEPFAGLLSALEAGAPPHGGFALGLDRLCLLLAGPSSASSIRDVMAFPKSATGSDPLFGAPSTVHPSQLHELGLSPLHTIK